jgi:hypothetical protein
MSQQESAGAALNGVIPRVADVREFVPFTEQFSLFDRNHDGYISQEEAKDGSGFTPQIPWGHVNRLRRNVQETCFVIAKVAIESEGH